MDRDTEHPFCSSRINAGSYSYDLRIGRGFYYRQSKYFSDEGVTPLTDGLDVSANIFGTWRSTKRSGPILLRRYITVGFDKVEVKSYCDDDELGPTTSKAIMWVEREKIGIDPETGLSPENLKRLRGRGA